MVSEISSKDLKSPIRNARKHMGCRGTNEGLTGRKGISSLDIRHGYGDDAGSSSKVGGSNKPAEGHNIRKGAAPLPHSMRPGTFRKVGMKYRQAYYN
jgi:hypothetical protein